MNPNTNFLLLIFLFTISKTFGQSTPLVLNTSNNITLPGGNYIIKDSNYDEGTLIDIGKIELYNGTNNELISTLKGAQSGDKVGNKGIFVLSNGNFIVYTEITELSNNTKSTYYTWMKNGILYQRALSLDNSLFYNGSLLGDEFHELPNGNVVHFFWRNLKDYATWFSGDNSEVNISKTRTLEYIVPFPERFTLNILPFNNFIIGHESCEAAVWTYTWHDGTVGSNFGAMTEIKSFTGEDIIFLGCGIEQRISIINDNLYSIKFENIYDMDRNNDPPIVDVFASTSRINWGDVSQLMLVQPSGSNPIAKADYNAKIWINENDAFSINGKSYASRHYEITPKSTTQNLTAKIKLYFRQEEFDSYNSRFANLAKLPTGPTDEIGKKNILIEKYSGSSSTNYGLPNSYSGLPVVINPNEEDIVWNESIKMWEVAFETTGFSGFFLNSASSLPLNLLKFTGKNTNGKNVITWETSDESNLSNFEIERSIDGLKFKKIGEQIPNNTKENSKYEFIDGDLFDQNVQYYRLKIIESNGSIKFSKILAITNTDPNKVRISPNPFNGNTTLNIEKNSGYLNSTAIILNSLGQKVKQFKIKSTSENIDLNMLPKSIYFLKLKDGSVYKLIKE